MREFVNRGVAMERLNIFFKPTSVLLVLMVEIQAAARFRRASSCFTKDCTRRLPMRVCRSRE